MQSDYKMLTLICRLKNTKSMQNLMNNIKFGSFAVQKNSSEFLDDFEQNYPSVNSRIMYEYMSNAA